MKSPPLCKSLVVRNENTLRRRDCQSQKDQWKMHWSMDVPAQVVLTGWTAGMADSLSALNSCRLS